jgi:hypothetical protein
MDTARIGDFPGQYPAAAFFGCTYIVSPSARRT